MIIGTAGHIDHGKTTLVHALTGDAFTTHFAMVMAGDGTFSEFVWWASGALGGSALLVGLGGKFGGGGAGN